MRRQILNGALASLVFVALVACATQRPPSCEAGDPDVKVTDLHSAWLAAPACTLYAGAPKAGGGETRSRAFLRRQAQNLAFRHPTHVRTRMLLAAMAYDANDPNDATRHLDTLLRLQPTHPEAAILRSRISVEEGNTPAAVRLLESQIRLRPDHAGLRESLASAHFVDRDYAAASAALDAAESLGGRAERVAYNRGLIAEEQGDLEAARGFYQEAESRSPGWPRPMERLAGLRTGVPADRAAPTAAADPLAYPPPPPPISQPPVPAVALR